MWRIFVFHFAKSAVFSFVFFLSLCSLYSINFYRCLNRTRLNSINIIPYGCLIDNILFLCWFSFILHHIWISSLKKNIFNLMQNKLNVSFISLFKYRLKPTKIVFFSWISVKLSTSIHINIVKIFTKHQMNIEWMFLWHTYCMY